MKYFLLYLLGCAFLLSCNDNSEKSRQEGVPGTTPVDSAKATKNIVFFGNSLTAGYGLSPSEAFPALIQQKIDSLGLPYKVINAGVSGETSSCGDSRIEWILRQPVDVFVLELGANDGLRGIPLDQTKKNLQSILDKVKQKYPGCKLFIAGMEIPPNMGQDYTSRFRNMYKELTESGIDNFIRQAH